MLLLIVPGCTFSGAGSSRDISPIEPVASVPGHDFIWFPETDAAVVADVEGPAQLSLTLVDFRPHPRLRRLVDLSASLLGEAEHLRLAGWSRDRTTVFVVEAYRHADYYLAVRLLGEYTTAAVERMFAYRDAVSV